MKKLFIANTAQRDLVDIGAYTESNWGAKRKRQYLDAIRQKFGALRANAEIGVAREDVRPGYRSLVCGRHHIFYRETDDAVVVLRVLHGSMDVHRHIGDAEDRAFEVLARPKDKRRARGKDDDLSR